MKSNTSLSLVLLYKNQNGCDTSHFLMKHNISKAELASKMCFIEKLDDGQSVKEDYVSE
jgi:hypothetical protein